MERSLRLHLLSSAVCVQPLRRSGTLRSASRQRAQRGRLEGSMTRSWRVTGARSRASISAPTLASLTLKSMISWKPSGSSMRCGFRPTGFYRIGSAQAPSRATAEQGASVPCQLLLSGRKLDQVAPGDRQSRVASGRALSARRLHRHQSVASGRAGRHLLQQVRHMRTVDQGRQGSDQVDAAVMQDVRG